MIGVKLLAIAGLDREKLNGRYVIETSADVLHLADEGLKFSVELVPTGLGGTARTYLVEAQDVWLLWPEASTVYLLRVGEFTRFEFKRIDD